jgi:hypothetical protein
MIIFTSSNFGKTKGKESPTGLIEGIRGVASVAPIPYM